MRLSEKQLTVSALFKQLFQFLFQRVNARSLAVFRILFGLLMLWEVYRYFDLGRIPRYYIEPQFFFSYFGFSWVQPWPGDGMYIHFAALGVFSLFITLGYCYRLSSLLFFLGFTYVFLLDQTQYLNHFYLISLISFLMIFVPAHSTWSLDSKLVPAVRRFTVPAWALWVLRFQILVAYFYGGIAKLNWDWLMGMPMILWLPGSLDMPLLGPWTDELWMAILFSYGGLIVDLLIAPLLLWRKTRIFAAVFLIVFNLLNNELFSIGVFPWFMMASLTLFFTPDWPKKFYETIYLWYYKFFIRKPIKSEKLPEKRQHFTYETSWSRRNIFIVSLLGVYVLFQLLFPFRHFLYPGDVSWTEEGHRFAWHMKLRDKQGHIEFIVVDREQNFVHEIDLDEFLNNRQQTKMSIRPDMILQFAHYLSDVYRSRGVFNPEVYADSEAKLNGRRYQELVDPSVNLATVPITLWSADWIVPLEEKIRARYYE